MRQPSSLPASRELFALWVCAIIFITWSGLQVFLTFWYGLPFRQGIQDSLLSGFTFAASSFILANVLHFYQPDRHRYSYLLAWTIILAALSTYATKLLVGLIMPSQLLYMEFVRDSLPLRYIASFLLIGSTAIIHVLWNIQKRNSEQEKRKADAEKLAREAELYNLRQQLQPHFLFNSLNSIIALIGIQPEQARSMTFQLSDFLRGTLRKDDQQLISLQEEVEHLKLYLEIEKVRFGHRLNVELSIAPGAPEGKLPAMIVQPLLENAIKYGLYGTLDEVAITLKAKLRDNELLISLENPYDAEALSHPGKSSGFGLRSVQRRLFLLYGRTDLLKVKKDQQIFTAVLLIPQYHD